MRLSQLNCRSAAARAALSRALADPDESVRIMAIWSLDIVQPESEQISFVWLLVHDADAGVRKSAAHALGTIGDRTVESES